MKRIILGLLTLCIVVSFAACTLQKRGAETTTVKRSITQQGEALIPPGQEGNTQFNAFSGGNIVRNGGYYYYISGKENAIYSCKTDGKDVKLLYRAENLRRLSMALDKLYFLKDTELHRMDLDGKHLQQLGSGNRCSEYQMIGERIYFLRNGVLKIANLYGGVLETLEFPDAYTATEFTVFQGNVYYFAKNEDVKIRTLVIKQYNLETGKKTVLYQGIKEVTQARMWVEENFLYFNSQDASEKTATFKVFERSAKKVIIKSSLPNIKFNKLGDEILIFPNENSVLPLQTDGSTGKAVTQSAENDRGFDVFDNAIFYYDMEKQLDVLVNIDGSQKLVFPK